MVKTYELNGITRADVSDRNCEVCTLNALYSVNTRERRASDVPPCNHKAPRTTLCVTATIFDDRTMLAYSAISADCVYPIHECGDATQAKWEYIASVPAHDIRIGVIDRRPGTRATSHSHGVSLTR